MMTLLNMYQWDNYIFDNIDLPEEFNKEQLVAVIMDRNENCILHESTPELFKFKMHNWFSYKKPIFQKLWETMNYEYNPIENYDRKEESIRDNVGAEGNLRTGRNKSNENSDYTHNTDFTEKHSGTETNIKTLSETTTHNLGSSETLSTSAFNETGFQNKEKTTKSGKDDDVLRGDNTDNLTRNLTDTNKGKEDGNDNRNLDNIQSDTNEAYRQDSEKIKLRAHGNIGVTTTQAMIEEERRVVQFHVYDYIAKEFETEFCLLVY